jgi:hypothetical protein
MIVGDRCSRNSADYCCANTIALISGDKSIVFIFFFSFETSVNFVVCPEEPHL